MEEASIKEMIETPLETDFQVSKKLTKPYNQEDQKISESLLLIQ